MTIREVWDSIPEEAFNDCREEIIKQAAHELAESFKRTKAWKEAATEILKEE